MKIIKAWTRRPEYPWADRVWSSPYECGTVVELHEVDADNVEGYTDDQRDGEWLTLLCPVCVVKHMYYPAKPVEFDEPEASR